MSKKRQPMGYIFPRRIKDVMLGDNTPFGSKFSVSKTDEEAHKITEEEDIKRKEKQEILKEAHQPWFCPICEKLMNKRLDSKFWRLKGMCFDCTIILETILRYKGLFEKYEEGSCLRNYKSFMLDTKEQMEDYLLNLKDEIKVVNENGTFDILNSDTTKMRDFISKELDDINVKLKEVSDIDLSVKIEDELGVNFKQLVRDYIRDNKKEK